MREPVGEAKTVKGVTVIEYPGHLSAGQRAMVERQLKSKFPGGAVVLEGGMRIAPASAEDVALLHEKLDHVIALLTDEGAEGDHADEIVEVVTLDGHRQQVARNPSEDMSSPWERQ